jgi:predicted nucleic acid-binding protein
VDHSYLLDTGIVFGFLKPGHLGVLVSASNVVPLAIVEEVYDEVTDPRNGKHAMSAKQAKASIDASAIHVESIMLGSAAADTLTAIRSGRTSSSDVGEAASIALAVHDERYVFVTNDAAATKRALQELRGRTMTFHPFLRELVSRGALPSNQAAKLAVDIKSLKDWTAIEPVWWATWLAQEE